MINLYIITLTLLVSSRDTGPPATGFRSIDGVGNNIDNPNLASYNYPYSRYNSYADYGDGISSPSGANRPNAKVISNLLFGAEPSNLNAEPVSDFLPFWGQFIAHDVALTQENATETMPVLVNTCDFVDLDVECSGSIQYNVSRALRAKIDNSEESALNFATGFIDGSVIYGSNQETNNILRTFEKGLLRTFIDPVSGSELMPIANATTFGMMASARVTAKTKLFLAGDKRANVHPALQAIHTLFVREHNRYARELYEKNKDNSTYTDVYIYERSRAWVIALIQKITYSQYYPGLIGKSLPAYTGYKKNVDPSPQTDFIGAAYRYGHSAVSGTILRLDENGQQVPDGHLLLRDHFFNTDGILSTNGDLDSIFRGLVSQRDQQADSLMIDDLRKHFVAKPYDLATLNIMRGRDFAIPSYNELRKANSLLPADNFDEITSNKDVADRLASIYDSVWDIDPWVGGLCEDHDPDSPSHVSPLFTKIIERQFIHFRDGDRFWYERDGVLTAEERTAIQSWSLSTVVLKNTNISYYPSNPFTVYDGKFVESDISMSSMANSLTLTSDYLFEWKTDGTTAAPEVTFILCGNFKGWMSIGFNSKPMTMLNTDFIIAIPDATTGAWSVGVYYGNENQVAPVPSTEYTIDPTSVKDAKEECRSTQGVKFKRMGSYASSSKAVSLKAGMTTNLMWAYGTNQFSLGAPHGPAKRGSISLDLFASNSNEADSNGVYLKKVLLQLEINLISFHGAIMFAVFCIAFPIGIFIVRYLPHYKGAMNLHKSIMAKGMIVGELTMIALLLGLESKTGMIHVKMGITMFFLMLFNAELGTLVMAVKPNKYISRKTLKLAHRCCGTLVMVLGYITAGFGVRDASAYSEKIGDSLVFAYIGWLSLLILLFIFLGELGYYRKIRILPQVTSRQTRTRGFYWNEINTRVVDGESWIVIGSYIYDVHEFTAYHPGGSAIVEDYIGTDATVAFAGALCPLSTTASKSKSKSSAGGHYHSKAAIEQLRNMQLGRVLDKRSFYNTKVVQLLEKIEMAENKSKETVNKTTITTSLKADSKHNRDLKMNALFSLASLPEPEDTGLYSTHFINLRVLSKTLVVGTNASAAVYKYKLFFEDTTHSVCCFPGDSIILMMRETIKENDEEKVICTSRHYTPIKTTNRQYIELVIKIYPDGALTSKLATLEVGQAVRARGPISNENTQLETKVGTIFHPYVLMIAAGSGITPMLLMIDYYLQLRNSKLESVPKKMILLVQNSTNDDIIMDSEITELQKRNKDFLTVHNFISKATIDDCRGTPGKINAEFLKDLIPDQRLIKPKDNVSGGDIQIEEFYKVFICGPAGFQSSMKAMTMASCHVSSSDIAII